MTREDRYLTLLTSLPAHGPLFGARQTPLSRLRLDRRLAWLDDEDAADLARLASIIDWHDQRFDVDDEDLVQRAEATIAELRNGFSRELACWRLELRTTVAALRRRRSGEGAPSGRRKWGFGRWVPQIVRHWGDPHFRLERVYPWLPEARRMMEEDDPLGLERLLLGAVWNHLERVSAGHIFDFEAVVVYVARWDLIARYTSYNADVAMKRFDAQLDAALDGVTRDSMSPAARG